MSVGKQLASSVPPGAAQLPPTRWSIVLSAGGKASAQSQEALSTLCRLYWYPLYAYLRRQGQSPHDAQDLTQSFFLHLLVGHRLAQVNPAKGKFRSFLLASLKNFLADERDRAGRQKRGGGQVVISLDLTSGEDRYRDEPADLRDPEKIFERRWAMTLLDQGLERLEAESVQKGNRERFEQLRVYLMGDPATPSYGEVGRRLGLSEGAVKVGVLRLRQRYRDLVREEVAHTVANEPEIEEEMRHLFATLRGP